MKKRLISTVLVIANIFALVSCSNFGTPEPSGSDDETHFSADTDDTVFEAVESISKALADCDYDAFQRCCSDTPELIKSYMPVVEESEDDFEFEKDDNNRTVRNMIASTITYEIDEASCKTGFLGASAKIDVTFSYKDYYQVIDQKEKFLNPGDFNSLLAEVTDTIDNTITLKFKKHYNEYLLVNSNDLFVLYDYKDTELEYLNSMFDMVEDIYMTGAGWDSETESYYATNTFEIVLVLNEQATEYVWQYVYRIVNETYPKWTEIYQSSTITERYPNEIRITYTQDELFEDGFYAILFYNYYDDTVIGYEFDVCKDPRAPQG